jgi:hypothetical protein
MEAARRYRKDRGMEAAAVAAADLEAMAVADD